MDTGRDLQRFRSVIPSHLNKKFYMETSMALAFLLLRVTLGLNILLHGYVRLAKGPGKFAEALKKDFESTALPQGLVSLFGKSLPVIEFAIGLSITLGIGTQIGLIAGSIVIILLMIGKSLKEDWVVVTYQLIYSLVYAALLFAIRYNSYSADQLLK